MYIGVHPWVLCPHRVSVRQKDQTFSPPVVLPEGGMGSKISYFGRDGHLRVPDVAGMDLEARLSFVAEQSGQGGAQPTEQGVATPSRAVLRAERVVPWAPAAAQS